MHEWLYPAAIVVGYVSAADAGDGDIAWSAAYEPAASASTAPLAIHRASAGRRVPPCAFPGRDICLILVPVKMSPVS